MAKSYQTILMTCIKVVFFPSKKDEALILRWGGNYELHTVSKCAGQSHSCIKEGGKGSKSIVIHG